MFAARPYTAASQLEGREKKECIAPREMGDERLHDRALEALENAPDPEREYSERSTHSSSSVRYDQIVGVDLLMPYQLVAAAEAARKRALEPARRKKAVAKGLHPDEARNLRRGGAEAARLQLPAQVDPQAALVLDDAAAPNPQGEGDTQPSENKGQDAEAPRVEMQPPAAAPRRLRAAVQAQVPPAPALLPPGDVIVAYTLQNFLAPRREGPGRPAEYDFPAEGGRLVCPICRDTMQRNYDVKRHVFKKIQKELGDLHHEAPHLSALAMKLVTTVHELRRLTIDQVVTMIQETQRLLAQARRGEG